MAVGGGVWRPWEVRVKTGPLSRSGLATRGACCFLLEGALLAVQTCKSRPKRPKESRGFLRGRSNHIGKVTSAGAKRGSHLWRSAYFDHIYVDRFASPTAAPDGFDSLARWFRFELGIRKKAKVGPGATKMARLGGRPQSGPCPGSQKRYVLVGFASLLSPGPKAEKYPWTVGGRKRIRERSIRHYGHVMAGHRFFFRKPLRNMLFRGTFFPGKKAGARIRRSKVKSRRDPLESVEPRLLA